jgi:hypothetical protein
MLLEAELDLRGVAEAAGTDAAVRYTRGHKPDVLVLDVNMPGGSSLPIIPGARRGATVASPETGTAGVRSRLPRRTLAASGAVTIGLRASRSSTSCKRGDQYGLDRVKAVLGLVEHNARWRLGTSSVTSSPPVIPVASPISRPIVVSVL